MHGPLSACRRVSGRFAGLLLALLLPFAAGSCSKPPASAYYRAQAGAQGTPIGKNTTGEACTLVNRSGGGADIFCGAWQQPSARIRSGGPAAGANLLTLATASPWRAELEGRFACGDPRPQGDGTIVMQCTRRTGGWPQVALVTVAGNTVWLADGTPASFQVIQRGIAKLTGGGDDAGASTAPVHLSADMASYLAARAFSSGDIAQYESLMTAGLQANLAGRPDEAEKAYRAALALQEKQNGGKDTAASAAPLMSIGLQLSDEGHYEDAKAFFARAATALQAGNASQLDVNGQARLALYRGLDLINQNDPDAAMPLLQRAEMLFLGQVPDAREIPAAKPTRVFGLSGLSLADTVGGARPFTTLVEKEALLGVLEARRNRAIALRMTGNVDAAATVVRSAENFARANNLDASLYTARLHRTAGIADEAADEKPRALEELDASVAAFKASQPRTRPTAEAELIHAAVLARQGRQGEALSECRAASRLLIETKDGVDFERMEPCLDIYAKAAQGSSDGQALLSEMFTASQLTRGSVTDAEIRRTAVRLAAGNSKVSDAIRQQQDAEHALADLLRQRDAVNEGPQDAGAQARAADLDKRIAAARAKLADADATVQAAAPNYQQLIQQAVETKDVFSVLGPDEAFVAITLAETEGWTFVMRDRKITVGRIGKGEADVAKMVKALRASIEPGADNRVPQFDPDAAYKLYQTVLGGVSKALDGVSAVTFAPTGPLLSVPFETLLTGPADDRDLGHAPFLVRKYVITHVPAAANFVKLRQTAPSSAPNPWFGFGNFRRITPEQAARTYPGARCRQSADILAALPSLEGTATELDLASRVFKAGPQDTREGAAFTVAAVKDLPLNQFRIIHFATHALLPSELACQDEPAIVTSTPPGALDAKGALLTSSEVTGLKLNADAVILSACNSGGPGGTTAGESLAGLARSFFYAGARALLVTHWEVDDSTATYLVSKTLLEYEQDKSGGLARALRAAQLAYLDRSDIEPSLKHPYYWAPFALVGEGGGHVVSAENHPALQPTSRL
ncbi:MAG TPA: CHAT domain-containing tetratricopeptide repeat protein [Rhodopila sp.]|uniref:CHAT domain-containing protein n=1 Tax=Rhodopila sp. TaxID=2480087 RepID=UPI002BDDCB80|nr:CHAT domain-containing tetratricopeptide repeat protein [Rhodopila sp.]HVY13686.1 CHAT domain-containing tetratricopeptide repeat protein [Rhodopila sp.]